MSFLRLIAKQIAWLMSCSADRGAGAVFRRPAGVTFAIPQRRLAFQSNSGPCQMPLSFKRHLQFSQYVSNLRAYSSTMQARCPTLGTSPTSKVLPCECRSTRADGNSRRTTH